MKLLPLRLITCLIIFFIITLFPTEVRGASVIPKTVITLIAKEPSAPRLPLKSDFLVGHVETNLSLNGVKLDVPYVDQIFVQKKIECTLDENGKVCYWNDCGPASVAMVLHYLQIEKRDVTHDRSPTLDLICQSKYRCRGPSINQLLLRTLKRKGVDGEIRYAPTFDDIAASIDQGYPVILSIPKASHILVATGYYEDGRIIVNDPYGGSFWWDFIGASSRNKPQNGMPDEKGYQLEYLYGEEIIARYGIFITGLEGINKLLNCTGRSCAYPAHP